MKLYFGFIVSVFLLVGCSKKKATYFAGQIINAKESQLRIFDNDNNLIHDALLNKAAEFYIKLDTLTEGLYTFKHGEEFQYLYLEPQDSIVMRLNTWDFDESLIFNGQGAAKNNFLIKLFLQNEKEKKTFYNYYDLKPDFFLHKTDSILNTRINSFKNFKQKNIVTQKFNDLVKIAIHYPISSLKERYARRYRLKNNKPLDSSFYNYRKDIAINDNRFSSFFIHQNYINNFLLNESCKKKDKDTIKTLSFILIKEINNQIKDVKLKNRLLQNAVLNCLLDAKSCKDEKDSAVKIFYTNCSDKQMVNKIQTIIKSLKLLTKNTKIPNFKISTVKQKETKLTASKNSVFYFWPKEPKRIKQMIGRIRYLSKKYNTIDFVGLDNQLSYKNWIKFVKSYELKNQYQLLDTAQNKWFVNDIPRAVIVNHNGIIQNDFTFISHHGFEKLLNNLK